MYLAIPLSEFRELCLILIKLKLLGYRVVKKLTICRVVSIEYLNVTDRRTDRRTDGRTKLLYNIARQCADAR